MESDKQEPDEEAKSILVLMKEEVFLFGNTKPCMK